MATTKMMRYATLLITIIVLLKMVRAFNKMMLLGKEVESSHSSSMALSEPLPPLPRMPGTLAEALDTIMNQRIAAGQRATFVQIGANDGITNDPLFLVFTQRPKVKEDLRKHWIGLQVEPQRELFDKLFDIHSPVDWSYYNGALVEAVGNITADEIAASDTAYCRVDGTVQFCETKTPGVGDWKTQGQVNTVDTTKCGGRNDKMHLVTRPCVSSFPELLKQAAAIHPKSQRLVVGTTATLDFLQIDVEGQDFRVMQLLLKDIKPVCLHYESAHLAWDKLAAVDFLQNQGYTVKQVHGMDTMACLVDTARETIDKNDETK